MHATETLHQEATESSIDRFARQIEKLEGVGRRHKSWWFIGVLLIGGALTAMVLLTRQGIAPPVEPPAVEIQTVQAINMLQPVAGELEAAPMEFAWGTVQGSVSYTFRLTTLGSATPLIERTARETRIELTPDERAQLAIGKSYVWRIEALDAVGNKVGESQSYFDI